METISETNGEMDETQVRPVEGPERRSMRSISLPHAYFSQYGFAAVSLSPDPQLMGSLIRRKKMTSVPIYLGNPFFEPPSVTENVDHNIFEGPLESDLLVWHPKKQNHKHILNRVLKRKQVSLDIIHPAHASFFGNPMLIAEEDEGIEMSKESTDEKPQAPDEKLFFPIVFSKPNFPLKGGKHGRSLESSSTFDVDKVQKLFQTQSDKFKDMDEKIRLLIEAIKVETKKAPQLKINLISSSNKILQVKHDLSNNREALEKEVLGKDITRLDENGNPPGDDDVSKTIPVFHQDITRATRFDYIYTYILAALMIALTGVIVGWHTEIDENSVIYGSVGLACSTPCFGNIDYQDFFNGHYSFEGDEIIDLEMYLDPAPFISNTIENILSGQSTVGEDILPTVRIEIVSYPNQVLKAGITLGTPDTFERTFFRERVFVSDFENPEEEHVVNVFGLNTVENDALTFTLAVDILSPIAKKSVLIAALIMLIIYALILLEVLHRTLIAVFGSMVALFLSFLMHEGHAETIRAVMLNMEWSTLGLLFGMMIIVGEMSHTGVFEWCAVRILLSSKGSFNRLFIFLGLLTAFSSAFLDNVTTMLLLAPVTIDMCKILEVDPRPYLIGEVLLVS